MEDNKMSYVKKILEEVTKRNKRVICYGAGMVLHHCEHILNRIGIASNIYCILDRDVKKNGKRIKIAGREIQVRSLQSMSNCKLDEFVVLVTCEKFEEVREQLREYSFYSIYNYADINLEYKKTMVPYRELGLNSEQVIPKKIHYCWFGKQQVPKEFQNCIASWRKLCSDYEIIRWDETNYDYTKNRYMVEAYNTGNYAYVTDIARLDILYNHGGFYMDVDVELLKNLDMLRYNNAFFTFGEWPAINTGVICGAKAKHLIIKEIRDNGRNEKGFLDNNGIKDSRTNCYYETEILSKYGLKKDFSDQMLGDVRIYSSHYFDSYGTLGRNLNITEDTIAIHKCAGSWK